MRSFEVRRTLAFLPLLGLALGVLFTPQALATDDGGFECTPETFKGKYMMTRLTLPDEEEGISHAITIGGVWHADGQGRIPYVREFQKIGHERQTAEFVNDENAGTLIRTWTVWGEQDSQERVFPNPLKYTYKIEPDCTGQVFRTFANGQVQGYLGIVLTNGGREGSLNTARDPTHYVGLGTLRRIDNADQELEDRVARIEDLLINVARLLGIAPKKD